jgi:CRISPR type I-E-associated protein CasB/Cse2
MVRLEHHPRRRLGHAAAEAGLAEMRFLRLLRDSGDTLAATVRGVVHSLASKNESIDWVDLARLVLSEGHDWGESVRRSLARDFYGRAHRLAARGKEQP